MPTLQHCPFCDELKSTKDALDFYSRPGHTVQYKASLITEYYYNGNITGQSAHRSVALKFCPVCGKNLQQILTP